MTEQIPFKDFQKLEMKVGTIEKVEDHPDADRHYVLTINLGNETRTIVAGLKQHYTKEELQGKQAIFITNLAPVTLRGIESQGMILAASNEDKVVILQPEKPMPEGSKIS